MKEFGTFCSLQEKCSHLFNAFEKTVQMRQIVARG